MLRRTVVLTLLFAALLPAFTLGAYALELEDDKLAIVHINVGQGAATLILGPADSTGARVSVLIDAGRAQGGDYDGGRLVLEALDRYGATGLDYFIATHYHADHIGGVVAGGSHGSSFLFGLDGVPGTQGDDDGDGNVNWNPDGWPDLDEFDEGVNHDDVLVGTFVDRGTVVGYDSIAYDKYVAVRGLDQIEAVSLSDQQDVDGYQIDLGASGALEATLTCVAANGFVRDRLAPVDNVNEEDERSLCFWLSFGEFQYLIGGDATGGGDSTAEVEQAVGECLASRAEPVTIDVLAVNHHGSKTSSATAFLADVTPEVAVISVGNKSNAYGHPDLVALERLYEAGVQTIYQTELGTTAEDVPDDIEDIRVVVDRDVVVTSDGESFWVAEELVADFSATPTSGPAPLTVEFTDLSTGDPTSWLWDFGDSTATTQNPSHEYTSAGSYTVSLTATNVFGSDTEIKTDYVTVRFADVAEDHWACEDILACVDAGIVSGYGDGCYHGEWPVTRDQMAVYISRALADGDENVPDFTSTPTFPDVPEGFWALDYVEYAVDQNVVGGYGDGTYHPEYEVTRDQMAVFVARSLVAPAGEAAFAHYVPADPRNFLDVADDFWAYKHVEYCAEKGVVQGYDGGYYHPEYVVRRDQMAVFVARAFELGI